MRTIISLLAVGTLGVLAGGSSAQSGRLFLDEAPLDKAVDFPKEKLAAYFQQMTKEQIGEFRAHMQEHGVVSQECARAMAEGVRERLDATWGVATTGVAGPDQQEGRAVGTVWVAIAGPAGATARLLQLGGDRATIRHASCDAVLEILARELGD